MCRRYTDWVCGVGESVFFCCGRGEGGVTSPVAGGTPPPTGQPRCAVLGGQKGGRGVSLPLSPSPPLPPLLQIQRGSLTMVVGAVGTGKSTLIKAMLGDVPCRRGAVRLHGRVAYVPQAATIFNATVRSNILFGLDHDPQRYGTVLAASGLEQDLAILPERDLTEIGEKGINLSGGQKQRVSIARALYAWADVVVFDDPLSALDAHVGEHVFNEAVLRLLVGQGRTVIMCTHQWQYLKHAHHILLVKGNAIQAQGTMDEVAHRGAGGRSGLCLNGGRGSGVPGAVTMALAGDSQSGWGQLLAVAGAVAGGWGASKGMR